MTENNISSSHNRHSGNTVPLYKSLRFRLISATVFASLLLNFFMVLCLVYVFNMRIQHEYINRGQAVARTVLDIVSAETVDRYLETLIVDDEYIDIVVKLDHLRTNHDVLYICVSRMTEDGQIFAFDADLATSPDDPLTFQLGEYISWDDMLDEEIDSYIDYITALYNGEVVEPVIANSSWGQILTIYEQILRHDGSVAAYIGVDVRVQDILAERNSTLVLFVFLGFMIFSFTVGISLIITDKYVVKPVNMLVAKSESFLTDDDGYNGFSLKAELKGKGELSTLEQAIIKMRRRVEDNINAIEKANERVRIMFNALPIGCNLWNRDIKLIDCNEAAHKLFGYDSKHVYINKVLDTFPEYQPDGRISVDAAYQLVEEAFQEGYVITEWLHITANGDLLPTELILVRVGASVRTSDFVNDKDKGENGGAYNDDVLVAAYIRDIRKEKAYLQKMIDTINEKHELKIQSEAAETASELKSQFLANMSHEIRTPMNAILGLTEIIIAERPPDRILEHAENIKESAGALLDLINDILDISKIQAGKFDLNPIHYSLPAFLDNINSVIRLLTSKKNIYYEYITDGELPVYLYGDDKRLRQILLNILSNAIKFTDRGGVTFTVKQENKSIVFIVKDTGIGIRREDIGKLFDTFAQLDVRKNRSVTGSGLGLSITKSLVEHMSGTISVESEYGAGSTFTIKIPLVAGDEKQLPKKDETLPIYAPEAKVLAVDDNSINQNVVRGFLQLCGITPDLASTGREAVKMIKSKSYDLVFMDHMMPDMDGVEATIIIREMGIKTPIIALTANAVMSMRDFFIESGMNDILTKPIEKPKFFEMLSMYIPQEKQKDTSLNPANNRTNKKKTSGYEEKALAEFWAQINRIKGLYIDIGLDRASGTTDNYIMSLRLMITEIDKAVGKLGKLISSGDLHGFEIVAHGLKGALENIGATRISEQALNLEKSAASGNSDDCKLHLTRFTEDLLSLKSGLTKAFTALSDGSTTADLPQELKDVFNKLKSAFDAMDFERIDDGLAQLERIELKGDAKEAAQRIKEAVMMMDYEGAVHIMDTLYRL